MGGEPGKCGLADYDKTFFSFSAYAWWAKLTPAHPPTWWCQEVIPDTVQSQNLILRNFVFLAEIATQDHLEWSHQCQEVVPVTVQSQTLILRNFGFFAEIAILNHSERFHQCQEVAPDTVQSQKLFLRNFAFFAEIAILNNPVSYTHLTLPTIYSV